MLIFCFCYSAVWLPGRDFHRWRTHWLRSAADDNNARVQKNASHWQRNVNVKYMESIFNSRWQQYLERNAMSHSATLAKADNWSRRRTFGTLWFDGPPQKPSQANLGLQSKFTNMVKIHDNLQDHPLTKNLEEENNLLILDGKMKGSKASAHESHFNVKLTTAFAFNLTVGYSRHKDQPGHTHAWVKFGKWCTEEWQRKLAVIFC